MGKIFNPTVTIGIPAHNEEGNIGLLLESIALQKGKNYRLKKVIVACDGCSDNTAGVVREFSQRYAFIKVIDDGRRIGQAQRLNEFYQNLKSDIFVTFDADVVLAKPNVISEFVKVFKDEKVGLAGGNNIPYKQTTLVGKIVETYEMFWKELICSINNGDNVHNHPGCVSAGRKEFLKTIEIPKIIAASDHYLYFKAIDRGYKFKFAKGALVFFKVPATFNDFMKQSTRFLDSAETLIEYLGDWVKEHYEIPLNAKRVAYITIFGKRPFYLQLAIGLQFIQRIFKFRFSENLSTGIWTAVSSSK